MPAIKVITDSASDLPLALREQFSIGQVPLEVRLGAYDPAELSLLEPAEFWQRASTTSELAQTAAPSPGAFAQAFAEAAASGYDGVCCITISSKLSATYEAARAATKDVGSHLGVAVIDSQLATMGQGLVVLAAAEAAAKEEDLQTVCDTATRAASRISVFGTLDSLEALRRGGRIGSAQALLGSMLSIKPVIELRNGVVEAESRQRTRARSLQYLLDKARHAMPLRRIALVHAAAADFDTFVALFDEFKPGVEILTGSIGPVIGAHTGVGTVGVCLESLERPLGA